MGVAAGCCTGMAGGLAVSALLVWISVPDAASADEVVVGASPVPMSCSPVVAPPFSASPGIAGCAACWGAADFSKSVNILRHCSGSALSFFQYFLNALRYSLLNVPSLSMYFRLRSSFRQHYTIGNPQSIRLSPKLFTVGSSADGSKNSSNMKLSSMYPVVVRLGASKLKRSCALR